MQLLALIGTRHLSAFSVACCPLPFLNTSCLFYFDQGCAEETVKRIASRTASTPREVENAPRGDASGREDQESKDRQQRGGEGHASHRGHTGKGLEERRHMSGNKSFDLVQQGPCEGLSRRDEVGPEDCC